MAEEYLTTAELAARLKVAAKNQGVSGIYNPVDRVKHSESLSVFLHCAQTVPIRK